MADASTHSSTLDDRTVRRIREDLRNSASAKAYTDGEIDELLHCVSDNLHGLFLSLQDAMGQDDGGIASHFMSGDEERLIVAAVAGAVMESNWDGESMPGPWDGKPVKRLFDFHPRDPDTAHVREQVRRAVLEFVNDFAAHCMVDEDKVERITAEDLTSAMERYVEMEAGFSGAMPPMPGFVEDQDGDSDFEVFENETTGLSLTVAGTTKRPEYVFAGDGGDGTRAELLRTADLDEARRFYADRWIASAAVKIGIGFNPDTPNDDYEPPLDRSIAREYDRMVGFAHEFGSDPYGVGMDAWEKAGMLEASGRRP